MATQNLAQAGNSRAPDVVIGVDTHKDAYVAVALAPNGGRLGEHRIPATRKGYDALIDWSEEFGTHPLICDRGNQLLRGRPHP